MEEAADLANYLPLSFKTPREQEYIEFLWDAFEMNYTHGRYQFAFFAPPALQQHILEQDDGKQRWRGECRMANLECRTD